MEFMVNEMGQPVVYIVNYVYTEHNVRQKSFEVATATLKEAEGIIGGRSCFEILEQNMLTREQAPIHMIRKQQEEKDLLLSLYKSGFKRDTFAQLDVRKPFQEQVNFPLAPELAKAERLAGTVASL